MKYVFGPVPSRWLGQSLGIDTIMKRYLAVVCLSLGLASLMLSATSTTRAEPPVVYVVLFYSPSCGHCHQVMTQDLPPLIEQYGSQLYILAVNTSTEQGITLYRAAADYYQVPPEQRGVPFMVVGDVYLMGSVDIPQQLPGIIENGLAGGGIAWPDFPGLYELLEAEDLLIPEGSEPDPEMTGAADTEMEPERSEAGSAGNVEEAVSTTENMTVAQRFAQDKAGNTLSVLVLLGMVLLVIRVGYAFARPDKQFTPWPHWIVPALTVIGMVVALYMSYVEITQTEAVCGPVGHCNVVQQSRFAYLFGVIPIGVFGVVGYIIIGFTWLVRSYGSEVWHRLSTLGLWLLAFFGTLFSLYLTFLEPFVIGASCAWCLTLAVVMALLLWATTAPVVQTWLANDSWS